ncbi:MAG TPA: PorV/PorQ family protein, partial [Bacteroidota bacterium]
GARYVATSGANISSVSGIDAITWNPAGLDAGKGSSALFSYRQYIADIGISYVALSTKLEGVGSVGLSLRSFNIGTIPVTTETQPDGNGQVINPSFFTLGLSYSKQLSDRVGFGVNINVVSESFGGVSASGIAFDAGVQYQNLIGVQGLALGVAVRNIGTSMQYGGSSLWVQATDPGSSRGLTNYKVEAASFQMPSVIDIGVGYTKPIDDENSVKISGAFENDNFGIDGYRIGGEYAFQNSIFVRAGYLYSTDPSGTVSIFQNYTLGAGVNLEKFAGVGISVDYAYVPVKFFSANHMIDIHLDF